MPCVIMVVDDFELCRNLTAELLSTLGYRVRTAASAAEALTQLQGLDSAERLILLTDLNLPGESGFTLCCEVKTKWAKSVTILSSGDPKALSESRHKQGVDLALEKPYGVKKLASVVTAALDLLLQTSSTVSASPFLSGVA